MELLVVLQILCLSTAVYSSDENEKDIVHNDTRKLMESLTLQLVRDDGSGEKYQRLRTDKSEKKEVDEEDEFLTAAIRQLYDQQAESQGKQNRNLEKLNSYNRETKPDFDSLRQIEETLNKIRSQYNVQNPSYNNGLRAYNKAVSFGGNLQGLYEPDPNLENETGQYLPGDAEVKQYLARPSGQSVNQQAGLPKYSENNLKPQMSSHLTIQPDRNIYPNGKDATNPIIENYEHFPHNYDHHNNVPHNQLQVHVAHPNRHPEQAYEQRGTLPLTNQEHQYHKLDSNLYRPEQAYGQKGTLSVATNQALYPSVGNQEQQYQEYDANLHRNPEQVYGQKGTVSMATNQALYPIAVNQEQQYQELEANLNHRPEQAYGQQGMVSVATNQALYPSVGNQEPQYQEQLKGTVPGSNQALYPVVGSYDQDAQNPVPKPDLNSLVKPLEFPSYQVPYPSYQSSNPANNFQQPNQLGVYPLNSPTKQLNEAYTVYKQPSYQVHNQDKNYQKPAYNMEIQQFPANKMNLNTDPKANVQNPARTSYNLNRLQDWDENYHSDRLFYPISSASGGRFNSFNSNDYLKTAMGLSKFGNKYYAGPSFYRRPTKVIVQSNPFEEVAYNVYRSNQNQPESIDSATNWSEDGSNERDSKPIGDVLFGEAPPPKSQNDSNEPGEDNKEKIYEKLKDSNKPLKRQIRSKRDTKELEDSLFKPSRKRLSVKDALKAAPKQRQRLAMSLKKYLRDTFTLQNAIPLGSVLLLYTPSLTNDIATTQPENWHRHQHKNEECSASVSNESTDDTRKRRGDGNSLLNIFKRMKNSQLRQVSALLNNE